MELYAVDWVLRVAYPHYLTLRTPGGNLQFLRKRTGVNRKRMVAGCRKADGNPPKDPLTVVADVARLSVEQFPRSYNPSSVSNRYTLMTQTDPQGGDVQR